MVNTSTSLLLSDSLRRLHDLQIENAAAPRLSPRLGAGSRRGLILWTYYNIIALCSRGASGSSDRGRLWRR